MKSVSGKKLAKILRKRGWQLVRTKGSHHQYRKEGVTVAIPIHGNVDLKIGLLKTIMRQTNLQENDLL
ncbi:type II toxin-antitoxin system HicA family toxin [Synechocystis sp. PCC 7338]|uniref:type II toxin-antitoxin system HicA family toxin n=1 Tax=Synechocystis sp. PCC 7338 TaxID=2732530 RepID=UPI001BB03173|nr:type II toxin-antitoxin system HicA family toxin [Synechocystis sp. PCC 7338]QUS59964.1 type II toxin-antitoxin system HicA family toxin [Synechocystis sp. PCC 7338]